MAKYRIGADCKLYLRTAGAWATPTWTEVKTIGDCQLSPSWDKAELQLRLSRVKMNVKTMAGISVTGKILDDGSTIFESLDAAGASDDEIDVLVLNGPITKPGSRGNRFVAQVFKWDESENPGDVIQRDFEILPTLPDDITQLPQRAVVDGTGAVVLTDYAPVAE